MPGVDDAGLQGHVGERDDPPGRDHRQLRVEARARGGVHRRAALPDRQPGPPPPDCSLLFLDDSQARRRRWCSMDRCGNLAKIAGYRARA
ncbi:CGNR zinc finger domain-containing protein [Kitasatospora sp. NPDC058218]|uniref:CGNR zinc finger domain-containing protein n=1 Tax=Kitasatospora sp. NPDC058218 TaxID=3346385 RepID=UPI0036D95FD9